MCVYPIVWIIGSAMATYLFNFISSVRYWALGLMLGPPLLGVTLALGPGGTGDAAKDSMLVGWWLAIAALSTGASLCLSAVEILSYRARLAQSRGHDTRPGLGN